MAAAEIFQGSLRRVLCRCLHRGDVGARTRLNGRDVVAVLPGVRLEHGDDEPYADALRRDRLAVRVRQLEAHDRGRTVDRRAVDGDVEFARARRRRRRVVLATTTTTTAAVTAGCDGEDRRDGGELPEPAVRSA